MNNKINKKEQWANEVLLSLRGIQSAKPSANLFEKISQKLPKQKVLKIIPFRRLVWVAAAACLLIAINIYVPSALSSENTSDTEIIENLLSDYSIY